MKATSIVGELIIAMDKFTSKVLKRVEKDSINAINITKAIKHLNVVKHNLQESLNELQPSSNIALNQ